MEETRQKQVMRKDKIMNEKGKTITESIDQGTPMGKMLGGWTMNQAEVDRCIDSRTPKSFTCDALDAYYKLARSNSGKSSDYRHVAISDSSRVAVGKRCKAYKVVCLAVDKSIKFAKGCTYKLEDFNLVSLRGIDPKKRIIDKIGTYFEVRVVLHGDANWKAFSRFVTCFLDEMRGQLGRDVILDETRLYKRGGHVSIQFRFAKNAKPAKKRR